MPSSACYYYTRSHWDYGCRKMLNGFMRLVFWSRFLSSLTFLWLWFLQVWNPSNHPHIFCSDTSLNLGINSAFSLITRRIFKRTLLYYLNSFWKYKLNLRLYIHLRVILSMNLANLCSGLHYYKEPCRVWVVFWALFRCGSFKFGWCSLVSGRETFLVLTVPLYRFVNNGKFFSIPDASYYFLESTSLI